MNLDQLLDKHFNGLKIELLSLKLLKGNNKLLILLASESVVKDELVANFEEDVMTNLKMVSGVNSIFRYDASYIRPEAFLKEIWPNTLALIGRKNINTQTMLKKAQIGFEEHKLSFSFPDEFTQSKLLKNNTDKYLGDYYSRMFDMPVQVVFEVDKSRVDDMLVEYERIHKEETAKRAMEISKNYTPSDGNQSRPNKESNDQPKYKSNGGSKSFEKAPKELPENVVYRRTIKSQPIPVKDANEEESLVTLAGEVFMLEDRVLRGGKTLLTFAISDGIESIGVKMFLKPKEAAAVQEKLKNGKRYIVEGVVRNDTFEKELVIFANAINTLPDIPGRMDKSEEKRVELHCHTSMSDMDAVTGVKALVKRAIEWGHPAIAITDHGVVQAFPDAMHAAGDKIKVLYGVEAYLVDDTEPLIFNATDEDFNREFVVFDIETTGLSAKHDMITEIGAVKVRNGSIVDHYSSLVNPQMDIPFKIVELTGITNDMVANERTIDQVLPEFLKFCEGSAMVAHNAKFDIGFIKEQSMRQQLDFNPIVLDTLTLAKLLLTEIKRFNLKRISKYLNVSLVNHHRAVDDAGATAQIFIKMIQMIEDLEIKTLSGLNEYAKEHMMIGRRNSNHVILFAKNLVGLKTMYQMISKSNIDYYHSKPLMPKSLIQENRENLLIGSACEAGELYQAVLNNRPVDELLKVASFYDYFEVQPIGNNQFLIDKGYVRSKEELRDINRKIVNLGEQLGVPVVAAGDVHFMDPEDEVYRRILQAGKGFSDADNQPPLYFRTTQEMLNEFQYLGEKKAREIVIEVPNQIAEAMDNFLPIPDGTFPPIIEGSDQELRDMCNEKAARIYGTPVPEYVQARLDRELNSIISNGYSVMYIIAQKLVTKSLEDGYLVGSRGSVGSSFAATMSDITEVNPLAPHYICDECKTSEFFLESDLGSGVDLPDKMCPKCDIPYRKDGHAIPFEVFLGFHGDKEPDIDLNFAGVYQGNSHKYCEVLFGEGKTFKAGTIGTIAEKTAFGYVKKYFEEREINVNKREVFRLAQGCTGVKRTSGQHPGGIMVIPDYKDVEDFCPIQYPANDTTCGVKTTHFDYHSISGRILKLDILGHDTPTIIRQLEDLTGVDVEKIPLDDPDTVAIFTSTKTLKIVDKNYSEEIGSLAIPEFGTKFVRQMLKDTQPSTFSELVRISGLSHGTDVWLNNAQDLVRDGITELKHVISTRDDIMNYLIYMKLPHGTAFKIMEDVRKGKGLKEEYVELMREKNVPEWYIKSCNTIKYMFPKAHAVAYVMMSFRIAYFKVHHPKAFYATFFSTKVDDFDADLFSKGADYVKNFMEETEGEDRILSKKEQDILAIAEVVYEFYARGFKVGRVDLYKSHSDNFIVTEDGLLPPLRALQGVGENAARSIMEIRDTSEIMSKDDLRKRAKVTKTVIETLDAHGCLQGMSATNQLSLFDF
ncbi:PolC-type DNA polymerase III [Acidaminobacter sp. JC074]|uniref:PolC-type DNA polymerase III n=1 Tax=Acidaminobacter sp. JC074 TaxID=2530199 RepID=UPI001F0DC9C7|nr:PolC-type DNA polymerase III [Acidaminobacter sp. JC074]MCH4888761.1 PolC-type DNA polymerase III [Acidaminobacter sp. JC074]